MFQLLLLFSVFFYTEVCIFISEETFVISEGKTLSYIHLLQSYITFLVRVTTYTFVQYKHIHHSLMLIICTGNHCRVWWTLEYQLVDSSLHLLMEVYDQTYLSGPVEAAFQHTVPFPVASPICSEWARSHQQTCSSSSNQHPR